MAAAQISSGFEKIRQNGETNEYLSFFHEPRLSTLYLRLPARAAFGATLHPARFACAFALADDRGVVAREGNAFLPDLADSIASASRVVLLLAAADVTLLHTTLPPLSAARLRLALPNLIEDQLLTDVADCVVAAGGEWNGLHTVAVVQRDWLQTLAESLVALGARNLSALPAQLCLPSGPEQAASAALTILPLDPEAAEEDTALTVRLSDQQGVGLCVLPQPGLPRERVALQLLRMVAPELALTLYVPASELAKYQREAAALDTPSAIVIQPDRWAHWIAGAHDPMPNLLSALRQNTAIRLDWARWRWPLGLALALLLVNLMALNLDWWHLRQEASTARAALTQIFQSAYPDASVIVDPVLQMQQKIASAKQRSGEPVVDDFLPLVAQFAQAWSQLDTGASNASKLNTSKPEISALEYRERTLLVRFKNANSIPLAQLQTALAAHNLSLSEQGADALQIRSTR